MLACLVHHADAVGPHVDSQRPLSELGRAQADSLAAQAKAAGMSPAVIWHSGKLRARETAEAFLRVCNPFAEFKMVRGLRSGDPPDWMRAELDILAGLAGENRDVLIVGHMPHIASLAQVLSDGTAAAFPLNGLVVLERRDDGTWQERWRAEPSPAR